MISTPKGKKAFITSEAMGILIGMTLEHTEIEATSGLAIAEKEVSLSFLADIWKLKPEAV